MKYLLLRFDNHRLVGCEEIEALNDVSAARQGAERYDGSALELWSDEGRVRGYRAAPQRLPGMA